MIGTQLEDEMWSAMKRQFEEDLENLEKGNAISLLAKWIKTADASSKSTRSGYLLKIGNRPDCYTEAYVFCKIA